MLLNQNLQAQGNRCDLTTPECVRRASNAGVPQALKKLTRTPRVPFWQNERYMADENLLAELAALKAENERLKQKKNTSISMKVSEKGAVSVYGLGRFPVTLYQEQWIKLVSLSDEIKQFIEDNKAQLKVKEAS